MTVPTIFYPDLSEYDSSVHIEPGTVAVCARATLSTSIADSQYLRFKDEAAKQQAFFFAYHWMNHGNLLQQAAWAFAHVGSVPLMLDVEDLTGNTGYSGPVLLSDVLSFVDIYRKLGGIVHVAYIPRWYWSGHMGAPDLTPLSNVGLSLVSSDYAPYSDSGKGWQPYGGVAPSMYQYTDAMLYGGGHVDFNAFKGNIQQLIEVVTGENLMSNLGYTNDDGAYLCERVRALMYLDKATMGPEDGTTFPLVEAVAKLQSTMDSIVTLLRSNAPSGTVHVAGDLTVGPTQ